MNRVRPSGSTLRVSGLATSWRSTASFQTSRRVRPPPIGSAKAAATRASCGASRPRSASNASAASSARSECSQTVNRWGGDWSAARIASISGRTRRRTDHASAWRMAGALRGSSRTWVSSSRTRSAETDASAGAADRAIRSVSGSMPKSSWCASRSSRSTRSGSSVNAVLRHARSRRAARSPSPPVGSWISVGPRRSAPSSTARASTVTSRPPRSASRFAPRKSVRSKWSDAGAARTTRAIPWGSPSGTNVPSEAIRQSAGHRGAIARQDEVDVVKRPPEQEIADRAAHQPHRAAGELGGRLEQRPQRLQRAERQRDRRRHRWRLRWPRQRRAAPRPAPATAPASGRP